MRTAPTLFLLLYFLFFQPLDLQASLKRPESPVPQGLQTNANPAPAKPSMRHRSGTQKRLGRWLLRNMLRQTSALGFFPKNACYTLMLKDGTELAVIITKRRGEEIYYKPCGQPGAKPQSLDKNLLKAVLLPDGRLWEARENGPAFGDVPLEGYFAFALGLVGLVLFFIAVESFYNNFLIIATPILAAVAFALGWSALRKTYFQKFWSILGIVFSGAVLGFYLFAMLSLVFFY
jgi:hypothetical protein